MGSQVSLDPSGLQPQKKVPQLRSVASAAPIASLFARRPGTSEVAKPPTFLESKVLSSSPQCSNEGDLPGQLHRAVLLGSGLVASFGFVFFI